MDKATRQEVYEAIDTEREYQANLARNVIKDQSVMEQLALIRRISRDLEDAWYDNPGQPPMDYMRKIAAVAVRSMEEHGAPKRKLPACQATKNGFFCTSVVNHTDNHQAKGASGCVYLDWPQD